MNYSSSSSNSISDLYTVIAFDPGGTTGWAVFSIHPDAIGPLPYARWLWGKFTGMPPSGLSLETRAALRAEWNAERADSCLYKILDNVVFWSAGQYVGEEDDQVDEMISLVEAWPDESAVVTEQFTLRQFRMDEALLSPVRINAAFRHALRGTGMGKRRGRGPGRRYVQQQPALAMTTITDERLKQSGYYNPTAGKPHARDAVRHALTFLRREKAARARGKSIEVPVLSLAMPAATLQQYMDVTTLGPR